MSAQDTTRVAGYQPPVAEIPAPVSHLWVGLRRGRHRLGPPAEALLRPGPDSRPRGCRPPGWRTRPLVTPAL